MTDPIHPPMEQIEQLAAAIRQQRDALNLACEHVQIETRLILRRNGPEIQRRAEQIATDEKALADLVEKNPELFTKPKTKVLHGIKVGFRKKPGKMSWKKTANVVARIKAKFSIKDAAKLIRTEEVPDKEALEKLPAQTLRALGVTVTDAGDTVVVAPTDSDLDKLVKGFMDAAQAAVEDKAA